MGAILYECLTGRPPFKAATAWDTLKQVLNDDPVPPRRLQSKTPRDLETICLKCLQKEPGRRYASAAALAEDLRRYETGQSIVGRPVGPAERAGKWVRRRPAVAGLLAAPLAAIVAGSAFGVWQLGNYLKEKDDNTRYALQLADESRKAREQESAKLQAQQQASLQQEEKIQALSERANAEEHAKTEAEKRATAEEHAKTEAEKRATAEEQAKTEAEKRVDVEKRTNQELARDLYFRQVAAAEREWLANNVGQARGLLAACPVELRNWEWHYVNRLCHADQITLPY